MSSSYIKDILLHLAAARAEVVRLQEAYELAQQECDHEYVRHRDDDYNHTRYVFNCGKCNHETYREPTSFFCSRIQKHFNSEKNACVKGVDDAQKPLLQNDSSLST